MASNNGSVQTDTLTQAGGAVDAENVTLETNQTSPQQREDAVVSFDCPRRFEYLNYVASRDAVRFIPRAKETFSGDGAKTTFDLAGDVQPIAGERELDEQDYPVVVAAVGGVEAEIESVDYAANTVTLASAPEAGDGNVALFPVICEGDLKIEGFNRLGQSQGVLYDFGFPVRRFHDTQQNRRGREINLHGSARWSENETLSFKLDSPRAIVWEDPDFPTGAYASTFELDVEIGI